MTDTDRALYKGIHKEVSTVVTTKVYARVRGTDRIAASYQPPTNESNHVFVASDAFVFPSMASRVFASVRSRLRAACLEPKAAYSARESALFCHPTEGLFSTEFVAPLGGAGASGDMASRPIW